MKPPTCKAEREGESRKCTKVKSFIQVIAPSLHLSLSPGLSKKVSGVRILIATVREFIDACLMPAKINSECCRAEIFSLFETRKPSVAPSSEAMFGQNRRRYVGICSISLTKKTENLHAPHMYTFAGKLETGSWKIQRLILIKNPKQYAPPRHTRDVRKVPICYQELVSRIQNRISHNRKWVETTRPFSRLNKTNFVQKKRHLGEILHNSNNYWRFRRAGKDF